MDKFKQTEFAQKVAEGAKKTGAVVKEGAKKTGAAMKEGAQKAKVNMEKLGRDIKASMDTQTQGGYSQPLEEP